MNLKKSRQDERHNYRMNLNGHSFFLGGRVIKTSSSNLFNADLDFQQQIENTLTERGIVSVKVEVLESSSAYCFDMWANSYPDNARGMVGRNFILTLSSNRLLRRSIPRFAREANWQLSRILRHGMPFARKANWQVNGLRKNLISIGYFHGNKYDNTPSYELDGYERRYASQYSRHDLILKIISVS